MSDSVVSVPTDVYLHFGANNVLLYVGITSRQSRRQDEHRDTKSWWRDITRIEWLHFSDRDRAAAMEEMLIRVFRPAHNVVFNGDRRFYRSEDEAAQYFDLLTEKARRGLRLLADEQRFVDAYQRPATSMGRRISRLIDELAS